MALLVQKFGGTSVGSVERIQAVAERISRSREEGHDVVVVVSAMGHTTDELTGLAAAITDTPPQREMDMLLASGEQVSIALLAMALNQQGVAAVSMTGPQVGIVTESTHGRARILEIRTDRIRGHLQEGRVVVVAGFQGTSSGAGGVAEITTLGRGGSDTSAVALAAALKAGDMLAQHSARPHHRVSCDSSRAPRLLRCRRCERTPVSGSACPSCALPRNETSGHHPVNQSQT